jgi:hypothetical protein
VKTQSCKAKGRALQQWVCKRIREVFDLPEEDVVSRSMGSGGIDVMLSKDAKEIFPFSIECKSTKSHPSIAAIRQSQANRMKGTWPIVCWKPFGKGMKDTLVYMTLEDFLNLANHYNGCGGIQRIEEDE